MFEYGWTPSDIDRLSIHQISVLIRKIAARYEAEAEAMRKAQHGNGQ